MGFVHPGPVLCLLDLAMGALLLAVYHVHLGERHVFERCDVTVDESEIGSLRVR